MKKNTSFKAETRVWSSSGNWGPAGSEFSSLPDESGWLTHHSNARLPARGRAPCARSRRSACAIVRARHRSGEYRSGLVRDLWIYSADPRACWSQSAGNQDDHSEDLGAAKCTASQQESSGGKTMRADRACNVPLRYSPAVRLDGRMRRLVVDADAACQAFRSQGRAF